MNSLNINIYADGADIEQMLALAEDPRIKGFTSNPTLMKQAGITDYEAFGREASTKLKSYPLSLEVFADDFPTMIAQGRKIASWGDNVNVKIPVTNTAGEFAGSVIQTLSNEGITLNITALMTVAQVQQVTKVLNPDVTAIISVFAGRIADTGIDPIPVMKACKETLKGHPNVQLLWASPREILNLFHADEAGCDIITITPDVLKKLSLIGKDLHDFSKETVQMFYDDAQASGYDI